jgi:hypothetical protein
MLSPAGGGAQDRRDMAMRPAPDHLKGVFWGNQRVPAQDAAQRFAVGGWPRRELRQGAGFDFPILPL